MISDRPLPAHEEFLGVADLLEGPMVALDRTSAAGGRARSDRGRLSSAFFSWVVLGVVSRLVVSIERSKHRHKPKLAQVHHLAAVGQLQSFHRQVLLLPFADDAVLLQADQKTQPPLS
jgi:hypothetical protein